MYTVYINLRILYAMLGLMTVGTTYIHIIPQLVYQKLAKKHTKSSFSRKRVGELISAWVK